LTVLNQYTFEDAQQDGPLQKKAVNAVSGGGMVVYCKDYKYKVRGFLYLVYMHQPPGF